MAVSASEYLFYQMPWSGTYNFASPIAPIMLSAGQYVCIATSLSFLSFNLFGVLIDDVTGVRGAPQRLAGYALASGDGEINLYQCPAGYSMEGKLTLQYSSNSSGHFSVALSAAGV
jgi:hypothetical protein